MFSGSVLPDHLLPETSTNNTEKNVPNQFPFKQRASLFKTGKNQEYWGIISHLFFSITQLTTKRNSLPSILR
jgi:hypothetical protein